MSDNIKVVVRARPLKRSNNEVSWVIDNKTIYQVDDENSTIGDKYSYGKHLIWDERNILAFHLNLCLFCLITQKRIKY